MPPSRTAVSHRHRNYWQSLIESGQVVPNDPYRERMIWLMENVEGFDTSIACHRLHDKGLAQYVRQRPSDRRPQADTSFLERQLGMRRRQGSKKLNKTTGESVFYPGTISTHIAKELAEALYEVLEMDPLVEQGLVPETPKPREVRFSTGCRWGGGCDHEGGHGQFGRFCQVHAKVLSELAVSSTPASRRKGKGARASTKKGRELQREWAEEILEQVA